MSSLTTLLTSINSSRIISSTLQAASSMSSLSISGSSASSFASSISSPSLSGMGSVGATGANFFLFFERPMPLTFGIGRPVERTKERVRTRIGAVHGDMGRGCTAPATGRVHLRPRGCARPQERKSDRFSLVNHRERLPMLVREESGFQLPLLVACLPVRQPQSTVYFQLNHCPLFVRRSSRVRAPDGVGGVCSGGAWRRLNRPARLLTRRSITGAVRPVAHTGSTASGGSWMTHGDDMWRSRNTSCRMNVE